MSPPPAGPIANSTLSYSGSGDGDDSRGLPYKGTDLSGLSDYGPFIGLGIPSGGVFTGAEGIK